jgi:hypothetical protein
LTGGCAPPPVIRVWTVVHGQLITAARLSLLPNLYSDEAQHDTHVDMEVGLVDPAEGVDDLRPGVPLSASTEPEAPIRAPAKSSRAVRSLVEKCGRNLRSVSESNLVIKERRALKFSRKSFGRQSLPQVNHTTSLSKLFTQVIVARLRDKYACIWMYL